MIINKRCLVFFVLSMLLATVYAKTHIIGTNIFCDIPNGYVIDKYSGALENINTDSRILFYDIKTEEIKKGFDTFKDNTRQNKELLELGNIEVLFEKRYGFEHGIAYGKYNNYIVQIIMTNTQNMTEDEKKSFLNSIEYRPDSKKVEQDEIPYTAQIDNRFVLVGIVDNMFFYQANTNEDYSSLIFIEKTNIPSKKLNPKFAVDFALEYSKESSLYKSFAGTINNTMESTFSDKDVWCIVFSTEPIENEFTTFLIRFKNSDKPLALVHIFRYKDSIIGDKYIKDLIESFSW